MRNMENDKNHIVEHIKWVSYTKKTHNMENGIVEQCISMSYNEKQWKITILETGFVYINE